MPNSKAADQDEVGEPKTVTFSEKDIRDAARLLHLISVTTSMDPGPSQQAAPRSSLAKGAPRDELISRARAVLHARRVRVHHFNRAMFGEPAWDILLLLYLAESAEARKTIGQLAASVETPLTTVLRWVGYLENEQLVERVDHPTDRRIAFIQLTSKGRDAFEAFLNDISG